MTLKPIFIAEIKDHINIWDQIVNIFEWNDRERSFVLGTPFLQLINTNNVASTSFGRRNKHVTRHVYFLIFKSLFILYVKSNLEERDQF